MSAGKTRVGVGTERHYVDPPEPSPGPWRVGREDPAAIFAGETVTRIATCHAPGGFRDKRRIERANAEHIVACVNACAGFADPRAAHLRIRAFLEQLWYMNDTGHVRQNAADKHDLRALLVALGVPESALRA